MLVVLVYPCEFLDFVVHLGPLGQTTAVDEEAMMLTRMILNALQLSNFALNFFLYCTLNAQFRRAFVDWFCRRRAGRRRRDARLAALGVDAVRGGLRRNYEVVRLNAGVRHTPRHDDVRANHFRSSLGATFEVVQGQREGAAAENCDMTKSERFGICRAASALEASARRHPTPAPKTLPGGQAETLMRCRGCPDRAGAT